MAKSKQEETDTIIDKLSKKYGTGFLKKASDFPKVKEVTSTGSLTLDKAIGIGGIPKDGQITQIVGLNGASKTTLAAHIIANEQKKGNECVFMDIEGTLDLNYIQRLGVDLDMLNLIDPLSLKQENISGEDWLMICGDLISTNKYGIIVLDSVAALTPNAELQDEWSNTMGKLSRMLSQGFRMITSKLLKSDCGLILLNQYRINIGGYGNPYIEAGGESLKYYTSLKIELSKSIDRDTTTKEVIGSIVKAKITKNKLNPPYGVGEYYLPLGQGIDPKYEIFEMASENGLITKVGRTYIYGEIKLGVGAAQANQFLEDNPEVLKELEDKVFLIDNRKYEEPTEQVIIDKLVENIDE